MAKWGEGDPRWIVEERPDATNVNNWHWTEKNACQWSQSKLKELLMGLVVQGPAGYCSILSVTKCEGEAMVNNRKGRLIFFYEWVLEMSWQAFGKDKYDKLTAKGKINVPNLSEENSMDEVDVSATVEENTDFAFIMKTLMNNEGAKLIREKLSEYLQALKDEFSKGLILPSKESTDKEPTKNNVASMKAPTQSQLAGAVNDMNIDKAMFTSKEVLFCPLDEAYKCFIDEKMIQAYTHGKVVVEPKPGGKFELFNGNIYGEFIELEENKRIKQYWRNKSWKSSQRSVVELSFEQTSEGTVISLKHSEIPASELDSTKDGWQTYYWRSIKQTFGFGAFITNSLF